MDFSLTVFSVRQTNRASTEGDAPSLAEFWGFLVRTVVEEPTKYCCSSVEKGGVLVVSHFALL